MASTASGLETIAQRSKYFFRIPLPTGNVLIDSLFLQIRLVATPEIVAILDEFAEAKQVGPWIEEYAARSGGNRKTIAACVGQLLSQKLLWNLADGDEESRIAAFAGDYFDRNPLAEGETLRAVGSMSERRRMNLYSLPVPRDISSYAPLKHAVKLLMIGHCDAEFGLDVLRVAARDRNIDLEVVLGHLEDPQLEEQVAREKPQVLVLTALTAKYALMALDNDAVSKTVASGFSRTSRPHEGGDHAVFETAETPYVAAVRTALERLRRVTQAPVLLHNLQVPVVTPLGRADRGIASHKTRVTLTNVQLEALALEFPDVFVVDVEGALALHGKRGLVDDTYGSFQHFGSLRWITQTPESFRRDVHGIAPPWSQLADAFGGGDVAEYDRIVANEQLDILVSALALEPRKCVVVELDGTLWPGVLAETGSPFALDSPPGHFLEELGAWGFAGLYRGIHEALKALKNRGIVLACVSRNDEDVVKKLWRYPKRIDETMLTLEDFVTYRINRDEKVDNIRSIAKELNLPPSALAFVDGNPVEREKVARSLPDVLVIGDNPFAIRWELLTNASLQPATISDDAQQRTRKSAEPNRVVKAIALMRALRGGGE